jgi:hypothetical protein
MLQALGAMGPNLIWLGLHYQQRWAAYRQPVIGDDRPAPDPA